MVWEENSSCICLNMQLIAILSRIGVHQIYSKSRKNAFQVCLPGRSKAVHFFHKITYNFPFKDFITNFVLLFGQKKVYLHNIIQMKKLL